MSQSQSFNLVDPFQGQSIFYLNPRTFRDSKDALKSKDLEAIHQHMNSMALQNPHKHFEKARSIVDGGSEFLNTKESEANTIDKVNPREYRPSLTRKRAKFSMKPDTSQPSTILEPSLQIDHLERPEEYFAAFDKFENTNKELRRQRGDVDLNESKIPTTVRCRRPELPRRKVSYKHHEYSSQSQNDVSFSQETLQDNIISPPTCCSQQESVIPNVQLNEETVIGSNTRTEDNVNNLFDELMSSNIGSLDENEAMSFLKDRLKIKPVDITDLQLPDFHDIPKAEFTSPVKNLIEYQSLLSDTFAFPDDLKGKTLGKQKKLSDNSFHPLASPTPPKSPFLSISTFGKRMSKSVESIDPYSTRDIDSFPTTTSEIIGEHSTHASKDNEIPFSGTLDSSVKNKVTKTAVDVTQKVSGVDSINSPESEKLLSDNSLSEPQISVEDREQCHNMEERHVDNNVGGSFTDIPTNEGIQENDEDMVQKAGSVTKLNLHIEGIVDNVVQDMEENDEDVTEKVGPSTSPDEDVTAQTDANSIKDLDASRPAQNPEIVPEHQNKEHPSTSMNTKRKTTRARQVDQKKRRQSLAEAGSSWAAGVRRSNRIKRRPLEYWKGERLLYGRVHNSLPTVIGVKYMSPTHDNGKPGFKVESFVSDKYKDLVELAALH